VRAVSVTLRLIALTVGLFACFAVASSVVGFTNSQPSPPDSSAALKLIVVCFLESAMIANLILRSRWTGWRLVAAVFFVFYGVTTFMPQIESAVFLTRLPAGTIPRLFLMGALISAPFSLLAVPILGKARGGSPFAEGAGRLQMPANEWTWKLAVIAIAYVVLYFTFGYFVAWRNPALREYYGGVDNGFVSQMGSVLRDTPWLAPFQILRALCWVAIAVPVVKMLKGGWIESALTVALLFSVLMNAQLLLPNPYMPDTVRMSHLVETASSNFIFGMLTGWLLLRRQAYAGLGVAESAS
jgi:hypothetical protein